MPIVKTKNQIKDSNCKLTLMRKIKGEANRIKFPKISAKLINKLFSLLTKSSM